MRESPQHGERWKHQKGWTVIILRLSAAPHAVASANPEFSHEVLFRYECDGQLSSSPLAWFEKSYTRLCGAPRQVATPPDGDDGGFNPLRLHPSVTFTRWRAPSVPEAPAPDAGHYSHFL